MPAVTVLSHPLPISCGQTSWPARSCAWTSTIASPSQAVQACGTGVLVLAGSSGRVDIQRARLLAEHGAVALPLRWFGGKALQPGPWEIPIETFTQALDVLVPEVDRLAIMGVSFGAEAALGTGSLDERVDTVIAFAPTSVVWAGYDEQEHRWTAHWTWRGQLLPYVPTEGASSQADGSASPSYLPVYRRSLRAASEVQLRQATIAVENVADVLAVSGGDDQVWPSGEFADAIAARRSYFGLETRHVALREAGHRTILPGEEAPRDARKMARGGSPAADVSLGELAWPHLHEVLGLT